MLKLRFFRFLLYVLGESPAAVHFPENIICGLGAEVVRPGLGAVKWNSVLDAGPPHVYLLATCPAY